ncbi:MAG: gamma-glutamyltransferase [Bdellovibrionaceae bacterium]|nr:gamma-glutamyltransferase [Pseudobdellovibrionaceae bacterium]
MKTLRLLLALQLLFVSTKSFALPSAGKNLLISGPHPEAVEAGLIIADQGGNAVDVAVAVALALTVTGPNYASLGGGGFAVVRMGKETQVIDFRETAPKATNPKTYTEPGKSSIDGGLAVATPGIPAGLVALHEKYGKLAWKDLFGPALRLSREGFRVTRKWVDVVGNEKSRFNPKAKAVFLNKGQDFAPTEIQKQPDLLKALLLYRSQKAKGFYTGDVAKDIVETVRKNGGVMTMQDMADYKVRWLKPIETEFRGYKLYLMPPPSSSGVVLKTALALTEKLKPFEKPALGIEESHLLSEILNRSFRYRSVLGDPDFHANPLEQIFASANIDELVKGISTEKAQPLAPLPDEVPQAPESNETTHFSVITKDGDAVAMTVTLNGNFGSGLASDKYAITLNNEMDDFTTKPGTPNMYGLVQGYANRVQAGKRPLSSMSPTLVEKDGKIVMSVGAPGGPRIITAVYHTLYRTLASGWDIDSAVQAPRVHHQFRPNTVFIDDKRFAPEVLDGLRKKGHEVKPGWQGLAYGVMWEPKAQRLEGAFDARGEGAVGGR